MMAPRLLEMRRALKNTGSIYLHCDPTASHYLKLLMDAVFGSANFRNEVVWHYRRWTGAAKSFLKMHDIILFYTKTNTHIFNQLLTPYTKGSIQRKKQGVLHRFKNGDEPVLVSDKELQSEGVAENDVWHIPFVAPSAGERIGYPTQKQEALLERIIKASSNEGGLVLDPFCGCGTTIAVAERLRRNWIGIDITYLAIDVIKKRFESSGIKDGIDFEVDGEPTDVYSAEKLARKDPFQFQLWCISKLDATPSQTKSADQGVDGIINFIDPMRKNKAGIGIVQVKGTQTVTPSMVRELKGTLKSQEADFAVLITLKKPTRGMTTEGVKEGHLQYMQKEIPKIQLLTVEDLFKDPIPLSLPGSILPPYKKPVIRKGEQLNLGDSG
jgi:site-specific DNA-methyltransferase (adenine-specific)